MMRILSLLVLLVTATSANNCQASVLSMFAEGKFVPMLLSTGKELNDLGLYDECRQTEGFAYNTLIIRGEGLPPLGVAQGFCLPEACTEEELTVFTEAIEGLLADQGLQKVMVFVNIPDDHIAKVEGWRIAGLAVFASILVLMFLGWVTEYSPLFGGSGVLGEEKDDQDQNELDDMLVNEKNVIGKALLCFSPGRNLRKLFWSEKKDEQDLDIVHGARVLTTCWVILGHAYSWPLLVPSSNVLHVKEDLISNWWFPIIPGGFFAVDVFFFFSSFLATYLLASKVFDGRLNLPMTYLHRYLRLGIPVILFTFFLMTCFDFVISGPNSIFAHQVIEGGCSKYWWTNILFIGNFYNNENFCYGIFWYLFNEYQFFLVLPLLIIAYKFKRWLGYTITSFLLLANIACLVIITFASKLGATPFSNLDYGDLLYFKPWARCGAYLTGILFGFLFFEYKSQKDHPWSSRALGAKFFNLIEHSRIFRSLIFLVGIVLTTGAIWIIQGELESFEVQTWPRWAAAAYNSLSRPIFVIGLLFALSGCLVGRHSYIKAFLTGPTWSNLSKLTFMTYFVHMAFFGFYYGNIRQSFYLDNINIIWIFLGVMISSFVLAIPATLIFEAPWLQLEKMFISGRRSPSKSEYVDDRIQMFKLNEHLSSEEDDSLETKITSE